MPSSPRTAPCAPSAPTAWPHAPCAGPRRRHIEPYPVAVPREPDLRTTGDLGAQLTGALLKEPLGAALRHDLDHRIGARAASSMANGEVAMGTYRALLRRLGPLLTTKAPWEPRPKAVTRRHVAAQYSPDELD